MKFKDAMLELKNGKKIFRPTWKNKAYLKLCGIEVALFEPQLKIYPYNTFILNSDGWEVIGEEGDFYFYEIIEFLYKGHKARLKKEWGDAFIKYDRNEKDLVYHFSGTSNFSPSFIDLVMDDWEAID